MGQFGRVAVIRGGALGDFVLGLPALAALRAAAPNARLVLVGPLPTAGLALEQRYVDALYGIDDPRLTPLFDASTRDRDLASVPADLAGADLAVVWLRDPEGAVAAGLRRLGAQRVLTAPSLPPPGSDQHVADYTLSTLAPLGITPRSLSAAQRAPRIAASASARSRALTWLEGAGLQPGQPFIAAHPGSGSPRKNWPSEHMAALLAHASSRWGLPTVLVVGPADDAPAAKVLRVLSARGQPEPVVAREMDLAQLAALLQRSAVYAGNDSGVTHLAAAVGAAVIAIFGHTDPRQWAPRGADSRRIRVVAPVPSPGRAETWRADLWPPVVRAAAALDALLTAQRGR